MNDLLDWSTKTGRDKADLNSQDDIWEAIRSEADQSTEVQFTMNTFLRARKNAASADV
ncbi:MAG: hypothetical protein HS132_02730 [Planctomycetia bacterium]|nr:hypothetical protein [Planctomycetia bacterium]